MKLINLSIDLTKIDKSRIVEGKNGAKYYSLTVEVKDQPDQYKNDVSCWTAQTQEERQAKANRTYLGNGRVIWSSEPQAVQAEPIPAPPITNQINNGTNLPF